MTRQPEGKLVASTRKYLRLRGARAFKIQGGADSFQEIGIPDILCCYKGVFVGLEAKMPGNKPSAKQIAVLNEIAEAGGYAAVFTTIEEVIRLLGKIDKEVGKRDPRNSSSPRCFYGNRALRRFSKR
jgi:hypothetical protein